LKTVLYAEIFYANGPFLGINTTGINAADKFI